MLLDAASLPDDLAAAHAMILAERAARLEAEAVVSSARLEIERLKLLLAKARREQYGQSSERGGQARRSARAAAGRARGDGGRGGGGGRARRTAGAARRRGTPRAQAGPPAAAGAPAARADRLPGALQLPQVRRPGAQARRGRHRDASSACRGAGRWSSTCARRSAAARCEAISQPPAPSHPIARGRAGPNLLALVLAAKYGQHLPLTRQSAIYAREGVEIDVSTLADWVGAVDRQPDADGAGGPGPRLRRRAPARRRHHRAGAGQGADEDRARVGLRPRRPAVRRARPAGGGVLLLARPRRRASRAAPGRLHRHPAGGRLCRVQPALRARTQAGADPRGRLLGPCQAESCSSWPRSARRRSRPRRCGGSTSCSRSSARSTASRPRSAWRSGRSGPSPWSPSSRPGCASSTSGSRASPRPARRSPTPSTTGRRSPGSWRMGGSASATTRPSGRCAAWPSGAGTGPSPARTAAASGRPRSTP